VILCARNHATITPPSSGDTGAHPMLPGEGGIGKSFIFALVVLLSLPGTTMRLSYVTKHAFTGGKNSSGYAIFQDELPPSQVIDTLDATSRSGRGGKGVDKNADSEKAGIFKTILTEKELRTAAVHIDPETKERSLVMHHARVECVWCVGLNWKTDEMSTPSKQRFAIIEQPSAMTKLPGDNILNQLRPSGADLARDYEELMRQHRLLHAVDLVMQYHINSGSMPDVSYDLALLNTQNLFNILKTTYSYDATNLTNRLVQQILNICRSVVRQQAAWELVATEEGHHFLKKHRCNIWDLKTMTQFLQPRLMVTLDHFIFVLSLMSGQIAPMFENDIMTSFAHHMATTAPAEQQPLRTRSDELVGDYDNHIKLGLRTAGGRQQSQEMEDQRYLTWVKPSAAKAFRALHDFMSAVCVSTPRLEYITDLIYKKANRLVRSNYYDRDHDSKRLRVMRLPSGEEPADLIPSVIIKPVPGISSEKIQIAIAVSVFERMLMPISVGSEARIADLISLRHLHEHEQALFRQRLGETPLQRIMLPTYTVEDLTPDWAQRMAHVDIFTDPLMQAIRHIIECATFRSTPHTKNRMLERNEVDRIGRASFLVCSSPRPFRLRLPNGNTTIVGLSSMMQLLAVRQTDKNTQLVIVNESRPTASGRHMVASSLGLGAWQTATTNIDQRFKRASESAHIAWNGTQMSYLSHDPDHLQALVRLECCTGRFEYQEALAADLKLDPTAPWNYAPNLDLLSVKLFERRRDTQLALLRRAGVIAIPDDLSKDERFSNLLHLSYPKDDILAYALGRGAIQEALDANDTTKMVPLSTVLLRRGSTIGNSNAEIIPPPPPPPAGQLHADAVSADEDEEVVLRAALEAEQEMAQAASLAPHAPAARELAAHAIFIEPEDESGDDDDEEEEEYI